MFIQWLCRFEKFLPDCAVTRFGTEIQELPFKKNRRYNLHLIPSI